MTRALAAAALTGLGVGLAAGAAEPQLSRPNLIVILADTLRPDHPTARTATTRTATSSRWCAAAGS